MSGEGRGSFRKGEKKNPGARSHNLYQGGKGQRGKVMGVPEGGGAETGLNPLKF